MKNYKLVSLRIFLVATSLIFSLVVIELVLRGAGYYFSGRYGEFFERIEAGSPYETDLYYEVYSKKNPEAILCIGDSFTNGGNLYGNYKESYPYYLQEFFPSKFNIINFGVCEDTTFGVYKRLKAFFNDKESKKIKPKYIQIIVGSADAFHLKAKEEYDNNTFFLTKDLKKKNKWFHNFRIFKMVRHLSMELEHKYLLGLTDKITIETYWALGREYKKLIKNKEAEHAGRVLKRAMEGIKEKFPTADDRLVKQMKLFQDHVEPIVFSVVNSNLALNNYDLALEHILKMADSVPEVWSVYMVRYLSYRIISKQSRIDTSEIIKSVEGARSLLENSKINDFLNRMKSFEKTLQEVSAKRVKIWTDIINLAKQNNVRLVLGNYPSGFPRVNEDLLKVSRIHKIPFVDNRAHFLNLFKKEPRSKYLLGDDHCTALGYKEIAKNFREKIRELEK